MVSSRQRPYMKVFRSQSAGSEDMATGTATGTPLIEALTDSQQEMIKSAGYHLPYFWAHFSALLTKRSFRWTVKIVYGSQLCLEMVVDSHTSKDTTPTKIPNGWAAMRHPKYADT